MKLLVFCLKKTFSFKKYLEYRILSQFKFKSSEAATKAVFICSFFAGVTFLQFSRRVYLFVKQTCFFPGGSICSSNRHRFSRRVYRTDMFFQGGPICSLNRPYYSIYVWKILEKLVPNIENQINERNKV